MILALDETRLLLYNDGLAMTGYAVAIVGAAAFWLLLAHWLVRARAWGLAPLLAVPPVLVLVAWLRERDGADRPGSPQGDAAAAGGDGGARAAAVQPVLPWWQILVGMALAALLGVVTRDASGGGDVARQLALMGVLAVAAAIWVLFFYLRVYRYLGRLPMAALVALRVLAVLLLVFMIFKPHLSHDTQIADRGNLFVLVDATRSMSVSDYPDTPHRMAQATRQVEEYLKRLQSAFNVKLYTFATHAQEALAGEWPDPKGEATNLVRAVKDVLASDVRKDAKIILMSDGLHNSGGNVVDEIAAAGPPPIYIVGVGTDLTAQSGYQDISIENVSAPEEATVNNVARLTAQIRSIGLADRSIEVQLLDGKTPVASAPLRLVAAPQAQPVMLTVTPTAVGRHAYTVYIRPDPAERRSENNEREVHILVTNPKIRVLYIEGGVRPEYKPLKSVLETDPNVELVSLVRVRGNEFLQSGSMAGVTLSGFPQTLDDMRKFDVFLIGDVDRSYFSAAQMENLKLAIGEGRGLVMIGGYNSLGPGGYGGTAMEEILPVMLGPRTIGQETTPLVPKLTPEGANHPIFHGTGDFFPYQGNKPKEKLPPLKGCNILGRAKPGTSVLAVHPDRSNENGPLVVLAVGPYGKGRAAAFAADTTYQWYLPYRALGIESPYTRFWGQMTRWLASKDIKDMSSEPGVELLVRKPFYNPGEKVLVRAKVRADEGRATNFADVRGTLLGPGTFRRDFGLPLVAGSVGVYEATVEPPDPGQYRVVVEARKDNKRLGAEEVQFAVGRANQEFERLGIDRALLRNIAQATGGEYYEPAAFGDLVERLRNLVIKENIHREFGIDNIPGGFAALFIGFLGIVAGEWVLRKYYQLN